VTRLVATVAAATALVAALPASASAVPPIKHVVIVVLENKDYEVTFGANSPAPYLAKTLPSKGAKLSNYYATGHLSLDNYISMVSGQAPNPQTQADCQAFTEFWPAIPTSDGQFIGSGCVHPAQVKTIADQLQAKGRTWKGYMEDMGTPCRHPAIGAMDDTQHAEVGDQYAARHNPFVYFHSIIDSPGCANNNVDYRQMTKDLRSPPTTATYSFVTPNLCNDGHDEPCVDGKPGGLAQINTWLKSEIPKILGSPGFRDNGLLIVTFDEAEDDGSACCDEKPGPNTPNPAGPEPGPGGGRIGAVMVSPFIRPGTVTSTPYNHYSLLRSMEDLFGLVHLGYAGQQGLKPFGSDIYNQTPALRIKTSRKRLPLRRRRPLRIRTNLPSRVYFGGRCRRKPRSTDATGLLRIRVRTRRRGRCRILAKRTAWRSARARVRVVKVRRRHR
jgi:hypothetical protein